MTEFTAYFATEGEKRPVIKRTSLTTDDLMPGNVTVRVEYSTINYKDALALTNSAPIFKTLPIVPGIMPITNYTQLARFSDACGAEIPRWIRKRLEGFGEDLESIRAFGLDVVTSLCQRLLEQGAPGLHFYTMNQSAPTLAIWRNLGLPETTAESGTQQVL